jgi:hypothetical protein
VGQKPDYSKFAKLVKLFQTIPGLVGRFLFAGPLKRETPPNLPEGGLS